MYKVISIGIDQSYTKTGISIAADGKLLKVRSTNFKGCICKSDKRIMLGGIIEQLLTNLIPKAEKLIIITERIRMHRGGVLSITYMKCTGALVGTIVDTARKQGIKVFSADTRAWKSKVVGTTKGIDGDNKMPTIKHICKLGFTSSIKSLNKKGEVKWDDDAADSGCIALYAFVPRKLRHLNLEE